MFIAFDGIDGAGKTTICKKIASNLNNHYETHIFDMGELGFLDDIIHKLKNGDYVCSAEIRECLYYFEGNLFSEFLAKNYLKDIERHILIDRYILSFMSYGPLNGIPFEKVCSLNKNMVWPDFYFFIDTQPKNALNRLIKNRMIAAPEIGYKNKLSNDEKYNKNKFVEHQTHIRNNFFHAIQSSVNNVYIINNDSSELQPLEEIKKILKKIKLT